MPPAFGCPHSSPEAGAARTRPVRPQTSACSLPLQPAGPGAGRGDLVPADGSVRIAVADLSTLPCMVNGPGAQSAVNRRRNARGVGTLETGAKRLRLLTPYGRCSGYSGAAQRPQEPTNKSRVFSAGYRMTRCAKDCAVNCLDIFKLSDNADSRSRARPSGRSEAQGTYSQVPFARRRAKGKYQ